ncbi:hypothetical protein J8655_03570 [Dickeya oryzae]|uniref:hypothetical protein n=1 Tax=Dickeya oryzae TaxID=1240404 RepID=UPI001AEC8A16|nr:hypothetical protein [Dickeya oryzae]MBP2844575.1 hypothetical protein [Dickeya oryzae]
MDAGGKVKPVLLSRHQVEALHRIQEQERRQSPLGIAPTVHAIARSLMDKALHNIGVLHGTDH